MDLPRDTILNSLEDAILCLDAELRLTVLNDAAARAFGCDARGSVGQPAAGFPILADVVTQLRLAELSETGPASKGVRRIQLNRAGADPLPMEAVVCCVLIDGRRVFTAVIRDISLQQQMERAVYEARKTQALGALASGISHDFNNILTAVISQIDLVQHSPTFPSHLKEHLVYAQTSARRGAELVSKLQAFSRQNKPEFVHLDPTDVIGQAVFMLRRSLDPKIVIRVPESPTKPWAVKADSNQLLQALLNLAVNARDAMPQGGTLSLTAENCIWTAQNSHPPRRAGDFVRITVTDTGRGMEPEVASRVFEPYFSTKDLSRGPGLGLSITSALVAEHSGWMEVESRVNQGTSFSIFLPRSNEPVASRSQLPVPEGRALEGKERLLVVDDEELVRMVTKAVLAYRGYQVTEAQDGEEAVAKYTAPGAAFDLVLMDMHMPRLNGYDALLRIRQFNPGAKAILLSGGIHPAGDAIGAMENVAFLHKPFENQELTRLVRQLLDSP